MDKSIQAAAKALFYLISQLDNRFKPLSEWYVSLVATIEKWRSSEGTHGVKRAKDILNYYFQIILGQNPAPLPFVSTTEEGIPLILLPLHKVVQKKGQLDARFLSLVLTICRTCDFFTTNPTDAEVSKYLDVIQESRLPGTAKEEIDKFSNFVVAFFDHYQDHPITAAYRRNIPLNDDSIYLYRQSKGPNGYLTENAHLDILTLSKCKTQDGKTALQAISDLKHEIAKFSLAGQSFSVDSSFRELVLSQASELKHSDSPGKLALLKEKAAKTRVVSQPDYLSQNTTRPLKLWLDGILQELKPMDVTFNQEGAIPRINAWLNQGGYIASFDQSSCTDLFPFDLQLFLLQHRFGTPLMEAFKAVTVDRDWKVTMPSGAVRRVRWSVGQPLGMFASWSLMAVTHHMLVQFANLGDCVRTGSWPKTPFQKYVICGDDIVIADQRTALNYKRICTRLGMKINDSKSHISGKGTGVPPVAEFTKKIFWKGTLLYPIKPNLLYSALKDARNAIPLLHDLADKSQWNMKLQATSRFIRTHFQKESKILTSLLTIPREIGGIGFRDSRSLKTIMLDGISAGEIHPYIYYIGRRLKSFLKRENAKYCDPPELERLVNTLPISVVREHPIHDLHLETLRKKPLDWTPDVPSLNEIINRLIGTGYQRQNLWDNAVKRVAPWDENSKKDQLAVTTAWFQALRKKHFLRPWLEAKTRNSSTVQVTDGAMDSSLIKVANEMLGTSDKEFHERQYDLVVRTILRQRFRSSDRSKQSA